MVRYNPNQAGERFFNGIFFGVREIIIKRGERGEKKGERRKRKREEEGQRENGRLDIANLNKYVVANN